MRSFGEVLRSQRRKLRLTQKQVADSIGLSDAYICSLESDRKNPPPYRTVVAIADTLKLDAEDLWKIAVKCREKHAVEKSQLKNITRREKGDKEADNTHRRGNAVMVPDSQINAFFERTDIQISALSLFQKHPKEMSMAEKRFVYQALNDAQKFIVSFTDRSMNLQKGGNQ